METCPRVNRIIPAVSSVQRHFPWSHDLVGAPGHKDLMAVERYFVRQSPFVGSLIWSGLWLSKLGGQFSLPRMTRLSLMCLGLGIC